VFREKFFNKVCFLSIVSVFLLFIMGGLVRSTGSGMGCPDWPKCFGQTIPPIDESQLPADYKDQFLAKRLKKAEKFTSLLNDLGLTKLAEKVKNDPNLKIAHPYNKFTAYTEWINRLFGVLTGVLSILCLISARQFIATDRKRFWWVVSGVFWVVFNGWLGSVVVDTNLVPGIVTAHYAAAYLAMGSFIAAMPVSHPFILTKRKFTLFIFALLLLLIEVFTGTSTREILDTLQMNENFVLSLDSVWLPGKIFNIHRLFGVLVFLINIYLLYSVRHQNPKSNFAIAQKWVVILFIFQILSGTLNTLFNIPSLVNVIHISASAAVVGVQLWMLRNRE
jgi:cytochrome c oxidase assembly protein subunit 15